MELAPRPVVIYSLAIRDYEYPALRLEIECGSGTYVRSLGRDIAISLGTQAVMAALERTAIGAFTLQEAVAPDALTADNLTQYLCPPLAAVAELPHVTLGEAEITRIARGQTITLEQASLGQAPIRGEFAAAGEFAAVDARGRLAAVLRAEPDGACSIVKNFSEARQLPCPRNV